MSRSKVNPDRLYQILQNTGLQNKDYPLYQLLFYLIGIINDITNNSSGGGGGGGGSSTTVLINTILGLIGDTGQDGDQGFPGPAGLPGADGANGMVPYFIASTETFTVPLFKQALFNMIIDNEGMLVVDGFLLEVD
jgi:hypothetical protein